MNTTTIRKIGCFTCSLMLVLFLIRCRVMETPYHVVFRYPRAFYVILLASYNDLLLAAGMGAFSMGLAYLLRNRSRAQSFLLGAFVGCALVVVAFGLSYVETSQLLGGPLTYAWLYYSDFMQNSDSKAAVLANLSWRWGAKLLAWSGLLLSAGYTLQFLLRRFDAQGQYARRALFGLAAFLGVYFVMAPRHIASNELGYKHVANPVLAFSHSIYAALATTPDLFTMQVPVGFEAFPTPQAARGRNSLAPSHTRIRNVVLFVLESVPAEYVPGYQTRYNVMPELARYLPNSLRVTDMYAQIPSTNNAVVSLLGSLYPMISYQCITVEHPNIRIPSLSSELKKQQFRTGFFFAADTRFQNMHGFLASRQFDTIADFQTIACPRPALEVDAEDEFLSSADESCLLKAYTQWLPADTTGAPFFATIWTAQTHYPYFPVGAEKDYGASERYLNHYLNALHYSDQQLGHLLDELKRRGLAESTLVVVVGDHGEAFGRHVQFGHASNIYEENVRIPLLLINPLLFHGEKLAAVGGQVDVAPTILDILRKPIPAEWQGTSLFNPARKNRAYFFSPYSQYTFGFRTPRHKVIFNANTSQTQVFDLQKDPQEAHNLADQMPAFVQQSHQHLATWIQYQNAYLKRVLAPPSVVANSTRPERR
ncbi:Sulfatase [Hymenobacter gelipurpurascens]|uniref:Sulfatase n=1 Tax=Hymenobacter gelipurpurascens TaxID=89968 RepID=A0A212T9H1_9BACT|nr:sulfatase-like hydrolase/transferase [Hymenobacter gelipurpurascens]SNC62510.1 Sulfatase [Hymenobacter gelipurpurascens]